MGWWRSLKNKIGSNTVRRPSLMEVHRKYPMEPTLENANKAWPRCFNCGNDAWLMGPQAGICINLTCEGCGQKINLAEIPGSPTVLNIL